MIVRALASLFAVALLGASAANAAEKLEYQDYIPGETTFDYVSTVGLEREHQAIGKGPYLFGDPFVCNSRKDGNGVQSCTEKRDPRVDYLFMGGILFDVQVTYVLEKSLKDAEPEIRDQLKAKYGTPTKTTDLVFRNAAGADIPYKRYQWDANGITLIFDEIGEYSDEAFLEVFDRQLLAKYKALTTTNHI